MNKNDMKRLVLLGMTTGILVGTEPGIEAVESMNTIDLEFVLAKPSCATHGGCGGLTAIRDTNNPKAEDGEEQEHDEDFQESADSEDPKVIKLS